MPKKPQYLTQSGLIRTTVNPAKDYKSKLIKLKRERKQNSPLPTSKLTPLAPLKSSIKIVDGVSTPKKRSISPAAAKAIATAISGMLGSK